MSSRVHKESQRNRCKSIVVSTQPPLEIRRNLQFCLGGGTTKCHLRSDQIPSKVLRRRFTGAAQFSCPGVKGYQMSEKFIASVCCQSKLSTINWRSTGTRSERLNESSKNCSPRSGAKEVAVGECVITRDWPSFWLAQNNLTRPLLWRCNRKHRKMCEQIGSTKGLGTNKPGRTPKSMESHKQ